MTRSCLAARYAESIVAHLLSKEARTAVARLGIKDSEFKIAEETLTETMLLDLLDKYSDVVEAVLFTRTVEARKTGADWLWCFDTPRGSQFMLVQAKRPRESMNQFGGTWTIALPQTANENTQKTQHETLLDAAMQLGVRAVYCLFMPARSRSGCTAKGDDWFMDDLIPFWPWHRMHGSGFIHLSNALAWRTGSHSIRPWEPPGITLSALVCCEYSGARLIGRTFDQGYWAAPSDNLTFGGLVERIRGLGNEINIQGALRFKVEQAPIEQADV